MYSVSLCSARNVNCPSQQNELRMEFTLRFKVRSKIWTSVIELTLQTLAPWQYLVWQFPPICYWISDFFFFFIRWIFVTIYFSINWVQLPSGYSSDWTSQASLGQDRTIQGWMEEHQEEQNLKYIHLYICTGSNCSNISIKWAGIAPCDWLDHHISSFVIYE